MIWEQVIKKYGKTIAKKMSKSKYLTGITITMTDDGKPDIPESDIRLAFKDIIGKKIEDSEWD